MSEERAPAASRRLTAEGVELTVLDWRGAEPALVLLPGAGGNALLFNRLAAEAASGRRVLAVDPPGHGASPPWARYDLVALADAVHAAVAPRLERPAIWGGHSWGGKIGAVLAARHGGSAAGALLIDPSPVCGLPLEEDRLQRFVDTTWDGAAGPWPTRADALAGLRGLPHYSAWSTALEEALARGLVQRPDGAWTTIATREVIEAVSRATLLVDNGADIADLDCPTLYIVASDSTWWQQLGTDPAMPDHAERVELAGRHLLFVDNPEGTSAAVRAWLARRFP